MNNKSYQSELDTYFKAINCSEVAERILYKGNLSKARAKLKFEAFIDLNDHMVRYFYEHCLFQTWYGFNIRLPLMGKVVVNKWDLSKVLAPEIPLEDTSR